MKEKQLQKLRDQNARYIGAGQKSKPDIEPHINLAMVSGDPVKIRPASEIVLIARKKIAGGSYNRELKFSDVFSSCNGYEADMKQWSDGEKKRQVLVSKYRRIADPLMRAAELRDDADPEDIAAKLDEAAEAVGLKPKLD